MNTLDIIVSIVLAAAFLIGYRRGFIRQLVSVLGLAVATLAAYLFYDDLAPLTGRLLPLETFATYPKYEFLVKNLQLDRYAVNVISFAFVFFVVKLILNYAGHVLNAIAKIPGLNVINRLAGALLGLLEAAVIILACIYIMTILPSDPVQQILSGSKAAPFFMNLVPELWNSIKVVT